MLYCALSLAESKHSEKHAANDKVCQIFEHIETDDSF
jgi:hypothetical protein